MLILLYIENNYLKISLLNIGSEKIELEIEIGKRIKR